MSTLTFSLIQTNLFWQNKAANLQMFQQKIDRIGVQTEIVILPEMFTTGFTMKPEPFAETMEGTTLQWMKQMAAKHKIIITGSVIIKDKITEPLVSSGISGEEGIFNRLIWMLPNGQCGYYNKRHLFAYAGEDEQYTAGRSRLIASVKGWKINLQICYDLRFPVWARQTPIQTSGRYDPEYDVLIYVANWPQKRSHAWTTLLQARAIENQCYVIGVNRVGNDGNNIYYSGNSMVIDPLGDVLYQKTDKEDTFTIILNKDRLYEVRKSLPFLKDGDTYKLF